MGDPLGSCSHGGLDVILSQASLAGFLDFWQNFESPILLQPPSSEAFPQGFPLVAHVSRAILNVTQDYKETEKLQLNYFPDETKCQDASSTFSSDNSSLSVYTFGGLFIITTHSVFFRANQSTNARRANAASSDARDNMLSNAMSSNQGLDNVAIDDEEDIPLHSTDFGRFSYGCA
ncbi:hypothetical protein L3X38_001786 [Prunus dulcis]|uniref:Uncharacterized protein n=1 Tax=Prunus dulcis TaxID=3755 RepID=A0AAD4WSS6_PRUDU|nr:hypothetical protein L3X38_001786 [Prunus dulcis]